MWWTLLGWAGVILVIMLVVLLPILRSSRRADEQRKALALAEWARLTGAQGHIGEIVSTSTSTLTWQQIYAACNGTFQIPKDMIERLNLLRSNLQDLAVDKVGGFLEAYRSSLLGLDDTQLEVELDRTKREFFGKGGTVS